MELLGELNDRKIFYLKAEGNTNWSEELPSEKWLVLPIADKKDVKLFIELANKCINKNVSYVCALGLACEFIHDIFDETIVNNKISRRKCGFRE